MSREAEIRSLLRQAISLIAEEKELEKPHFQPRAREFDPDAAWRFIQQLLPDHPAYRQARRAYMVFAHWLWNTGTHDNPTIWKILEDRLRYHPANPYAYYAPGGPARENTQAKLAIEFAERENAAFKAADREFLKR